MGTKGRWSSSSSVAMESATYVRYMRKLQDLNRPRLRLFAANSVVASAEDRALTMTTSLVGPFVGWTGSRVVTILHYDSVSNGQVELGLEA